jgi:hypothetical protein
MLDSVGLELGLLGGEGEGESDEIRFQLALLVGAWREKEIVPPVAGT